MNLSGILKLSEPQEKWHAGILHNFIKIMWLPYIWCSKWYLLLRMLELKASHLVWLLLLQRWKQDLRGKGTCLDLLMVLESLIILLLCLLLVGTAVAQISPKTSWFSSSGDICIDILLVLPAALVGSEHRKTLCPLGSQHLSLLRKVRSVSGDLCLLNLSVPQGFILGYWLSHSVELHSHFPYLLW